MASEAVDRVKQSTVTDAASQSGTTQIAYSVGVMAYNEEANIGRTLKAILEQASDKTCITEVIVVASGCTDRTVDVVREMQEADSRIQLHVQERREGKASAINLFLQCASSPVLVMVGADIIPEQDTLEKLCAHFADPAVGMVGAHPMPVNDQDNFVGHAVHLLWLLHDRMARRSPKLGEVVAFRNVVRRIPIDTAVDEISIQAVIAAQQFQLVYEPEAIVYNKGPMTVRDFLKQRRRIHAGHLRIQAQEHYAASTMKVGPILEELLICAPYTLGNPKQVLWTLGTVGLEALARGQGHYDVMRKHSHHVWQAVASTKALEDEQRKLRRICKTQSIIAFHVQREGANMHDIGEARLTRTMIQKLLPLLRKHIRKDDLISFHGTNMLVVVLNAEQSGVEDIATRLKEIMEAQRIPLDKHGYAQPQVRYHTVSFGQ